MEKEHRERGDLVPLNYCDGSLNCSDQIRLARTHTKHNFDHTSKYDEINILLVVFWNVSLGSVF